MGQREAGRISALRISEFSFAIHVRFAHLLLQWSAVAFVSFASFVRFVSAPVGVRVAWT